MDLLEPGGLRIVAYRLERREAERAGGSGRAGVVLPHHHPDLVEPVGDDGAAGDI